MISSWVFYGNPLKYSYDIPYEYLSTLRYYHTKYAFQIESTLYSWLNVKKLLAWNRRDI